MPAGRVAIIGGGAIGSAVAYWLTADPAFAGEVVVVERDPAYRAASSALSASSIRQQFSTPGQHRDRPVRHRLPARASASTLAVERRAPGHRPGRARLSVPGDRARHGDAAREPCRAGARTVPTSSCSTPDGAAPPLSLARGRGSGRRLATGAPARAGSTATACCAPSAPRRSPRVPAISRPRPWASKWPATGSVASASPTAKRSPAMSWSTPPDPGPRVSPPWPASSCRSARGRARCSCWRARPPCPAARW